MAGSKSEMRGKRAARHINAEVMLLCDMIHQEGQQLEDGTAVISFGDLFQASLVGRVEGLRAGGFGIAAGSAFKVQIYFRMSLVFKVER